MSLKIIALIIMGIIVSFDIGWLFGLWWADMCDRRREEKRRENERILSDN